MQKRKPRILTDLSDTEFAAVEAAERLRNRMPDWKQAWLASSTLSDPNKLDRVLADEHEHGLLFADAAEAYLASKPRGERALRSLRPKWEVLKPLLHGV